MMRSYGIIGTGAIGGYFAVNLQKAGFEVHCLLNSDYSHVKEAGLLLISGEEEFTISPHSYDQIQHMPQCDVILITLKTTANGILNDTFTRLIKHNTLVVVLQNGIGVEQEMEEIIEPQRIIGGSCSIKVTRIFPGVIKHEGSNQLEISSYVDSSEISSDLIMQFENFIRDLKLAGLKASVSDHLPTMRWKKLIHNIPLSGLSTVYNASTQEIIENHYEEVLAITKELIFTAKKCGAHLPDNYFEFRLQVLDSIKKLPAIYSSMKIDFDNRKPLELRAIYENPIKLASQHQLAMPLTETLYIHLQKMNQENLIKNNDDSHQFLSSSSNAESDPTGQAGGLMSVTP